MCFSKKKSGINGKGKYQEIMCMNHFEEKYLWKYDSPCTNGDPDIIISEIIRFNKLLFLSVRYTLLAGIV